MADQTIQNRGLLLTSFNTPPKLADLPLPEATPGSAVVSVLATSVPQYSSTIYSGAMGWDLPLPMTPGLGGIGRIHEVGPDAAKLKVGDLVFIDPMIIARDDADVSFLLGHFEGMHPQGRLLMDKVWRNSTLQRFVAVPLECCVVMDENRLCKELGYSFAELTILLPYAVGAGPLFETANVQAGETVVVGPGTGRYSGAAVEVALAVGANVVALGRSEEKLSRLQKALGNPKRLKTVAMSGKAGEDTAALKQAIPQGVDVYNDWSPTGSTEALYLETVAPILKKNARVALSGNVNSAKGIPYVLMVIKDISIGGKFMYERRTVERVSNLVSSGLLELGERAGAVLHTFSLEQVAESLEFAAEHVEGNTFAVVTPNTA